LLVRTPRGGIHRYFEHPKDQEYGNAVQLDRLPGLDIRADNAYVLLPPSTLFAGKAQYRFVKEDFLIAKTPVWLFKFIVNHISSSHEIASSSQGNHISERPSEKWL